MIGKRALFLTALVPMLWLPLAGCHKADDGLSQDQVQKADRLSEIAKKSDGDWSKVSDADKDYVLKEVTHGDEASAKMLLLAKAGKLKGAPGGAPAH